MRKGSWPEAKNALERAKAWLVNRGSDDLRSRVDQGARDLQMVARLHSIRLTGYAAVGESIDFARSNKLYEEAFREAGFDDFDNHPEIVAAKVKHSNIRTALLAAIDIWSFRARDSRRRRWALDVARQADGDNSGWRDRACDPAIWKDRAALFKVIESAPVPEESVALLLAIERNTDAPDEVRGAFLKRVHERSPRDFWLDFRLGDVLLRAGKPSEAVGYYQAALAIGPEVAELHNNLGAALTRTSRHEEAIVHYRRAIVLDPTAFTSRLNLTVDLWHMGRTDEVVRELPAALRLNPRSPELHALSGKILEINNQHGQALDQYRQAVAIDPKYTAGQRALRLLLMRQGREDDARIAWGKALDEDPSEHAAWYGYAEFCLYLGREEEYLRARRALLAKFGATIDPMIAERSGRACLLRPASGEELRRAVVLAERAGAVQKARASALYASFQFVRGLAEYRQGHLDPAISLMRGEASGADGPAPRLVLAMALYQSGRVAEARKTLAEAVLGYDWRAIMVRDQDGWIRHALRREAETMILPDLPAFLDGKRDRRDNDERLALLGVCQFTNRTGTLARLYADAFAALPQMATEVGAGHRYNAARAAAMAGTGHGEDAGSLSQEERTRWRKQARAWLALDLAAWARKLDGGIAVDRDLVRRTLTSWLADPDFAGLREPAALKMLSVEERDEWLAFWEKVEALIKRTAGP